MSDLPDHLAECSEWVDAPPTLSPENERRVNAYWAAKTYDHLSAALAGLENRRVDVVEVEKRINQGGLAWSMVACNYDKVKL